MSILIDYSGVSISSVMLSLKGDYSIDENFVRHIILNVLRAVRSKNADAGEIVICCDSSNSWRKQKFPYYKANRKKLREDSKVDWSELLRIINKLADELRDNFPYKVIKVPETEADDIIATIAIREPSNHIIVSNDKDFFQLQKLPNVKIYQPKNGSLVTCPNPDTFLVEHIIRGDLGDGIPNIFSDDDTLINSTKRQKPIRATKLAEWVNSEPATVFNQDQLDNYRRNEELISLFKIPEDISEKIYETYIQTQVVGHRGTKMMSYFMKNNLRHLLDSITEF